MVENTREMAESAEKLEQRLTSTTEFSKGLKEKLNKIKAEAKTDALTKIHNRMAFDEKIEELINSAKEGGPGFSVIMLDIDFFKKFNDKYGHLIGDEILKITGSILKSNLKGSDFPARYGGRSFSGRVFSTGGQ